jgi:hypothetical protein
VNELGACVRSRELVYGTARRPEHAVFLTQKDCVVGEVEAETLSVFRTRYVEDGYACKAVSCSRLQRFVRLASRSQQLALSRPHDPLPTELSPMMQVAICALQLTMTCAPQRQMGSGS